MIVAGIDEAGLGPALGVMTVCCSIFSHPHSITPEQPWDLYSEVAKKKKSKNDSRLLVADSKVAHKAEGLAGLESTCLSFYAAAGGALPGSIAQILSSSGSKETLDSMAKQPWHNPENLQAPLFSNEEIIKNNIAKIKDSSLTIEALRARVLTEEMLNELFDRGLNKSEVLLLQTGEHIRHIFNTYKDEEVLITVDKQGGRNYYAPYLTDLLDGAWINTITEGPECSEYTVNNLRIRFEPKADKNAFAVALSSIFAKYLRECFMNELNNYFTEFIPDLKPTAGYHGDAPRFMSDIKDVLLNENIDRDQLWRKR